MVLTLFSSWFHRKCGGPLDSTKSPISLAQMHFSNLSLTRSPPTAFDLTHHRNTFANDLGFPLGNHQKSLSYHLLYAPKMSSNGRSAKRCHPRRSTCPLLIPITSMPASRRSAPASMALWSVLPIATKRTFTSPSSGVVWILIVNTEWLLSVNSKSWRPPIPI